MNFFCRKRMCALLGALGLAVVSAYADGAADMPNDDGVASCALAPNVMNRLDKRLKDNVWGAY